MSGQGERPEGVALPPWERPFTVKPGGSAAGMDLRGMELRGNLARIDFRDAIFGAWDPIEDGGGEDDDYGPGGTPDPVWTDFSGADLNGANFFGADLSGVNFSMANLSGADLGSCVTGETRFDEANLTGANLKGVDLETASWYGATIEGVVGLDEADETTLAELLNTYL